MIVSIILNICLVITKLKIENKRDEVSESPSKNLSNQKISNNDYTTQNKNKPAQIQWNIQAKPESNHPREESLENKSSTVVNTVSSPLKSKRFDNVKKTEVSSEPNKPFEKGFFNQTQLNSQNSMDLNVIKQIIQDSNPGPGLNKITYKEKSSKEKEDPDKTEKTESNQNKEFGIQNSRRKKNLDTGGDKMFQATFYAVDTKIKDNFKSSVGQECNGTNKNSSNDNVDSILSKHKQ